jgi:hypothetical protein
MTIGPIQIIVFSFDRIDRFRGEVLEELARLRESGEIRLVDLLLAVKEPDGQITATETKDLTPDESIEFGVVIGRLLGFSDISMADRDPDEMAADLLNACWRLPPNLWGSITRGSKNWSWTFSRVRHSAC